MTVVAFLGPTMPVAEAHRLCRATYMPPVRMGDVYAAVEEGAKAIVIIDGAFQNAPSVWHKEILFALSRGVRVFGSSSMGALRAAELHTFGMEGVGTVFEAFRDGVWEDDDEVAIVHASAEFGFRPLSDAMVNLRAGLSLATAANIISENSRQKLADIAKGLFYAERSWNRLLTAAPLLGIAAAEIEALHRFVETERPDAKRADAVALLTLVATEMENGLRPHSPTFTFQESYVWRSLVETETARRTREIICGEPGEHVTLADIGDHVRLFESDRVDILRAALSHYLVTRECERRGALVAPTNGMEHLTALNQMSDKLLAEFNRNLDRYIAVELQRRGLFEKIQSKVARRYSLAAASTRTQPENVRPPDEEILEWFHKVYGGPSGIAEEVAGAVGLPSADALLTVLMAEYLSANHDSPSE